MTTQQNTSPLGFLGALRLAASARVHSLSGLALNVLPRDRDLDRMSAELMFAAQDETPTESPAPLRQRQPVAAPGWLRHPAQTPLGR